MSKNLVREWMTSKLVTVSQNNPLRDAYWLMIDNKVRRLPVMDKGRLVGIITMEDLRRAEPPTGIGLNLVKITDVLSKMTVRQVMTKDPMTIAPDASLMDAAQTMLDHRISALPVIEDDQLVGIITESDIFRAFVKMEGEKQVQTS
jgi:acetoin utilization protein AcuB